MTYLSLPTPIRHFDEFKKAAQLTGHNTQVYFEVGRVLLSRWDSLTADEREMTLDILQKMLAGQDREKFQTLLEIWYLHARDGSLIERIMPESENFYLTYAGFLGDRSLSIQDRFRAMARAESLAFRQAKSSFELGQRRYDYYRGENALRHLTDCLRSLNSIRFYQSLTGETPIDIEEYNRIRRDAYLLLAKIQIDETRTLNDPDSYIQTYLKFEDRLQAINEFERFIRDRGLLGDGGGTVSVRKDFDALALQMDLHFKQNRYREITKAADMLESNLLIVPEAGREAYVRILRIIGDSYLKLDFIYEAEKYFLQALDIYPDNLKSLLGLKRCYERLNDDIRAGAVQEAVDALITPPEFVPEGDVFYKGKTRSIEFVSDGTPVVCRISLEPEISGLQPLVSVFFDGRIVWEEYVEQGEISFSLTPGVGDNAFLVSPVNTSIVLSRIAIESRPSE
jgi:tetratricopeptide (TPR) repeat protein